MLFARVTVRPLLARTAKSRQHGELPVAPLRGLHDLVRLESALQRFRELHRSEESAAPVRAAQKTLGAARARIRKSGRLGQAGNWESIRFADPHESFLHVPDDDVIPSVGARPVTRTSGTALRRLRRWLRHGVKNARLLATAKPNRVISFTPAVLRRGLARNLLSEELESRDRSKYQLAKGKR